MNRPKSFPAFSLRMASMAENLAGMGRMSVFLAGSGLLTGTALATNNNWTGSAGTDWNNPANWSLNRVPKDPNGDVAPADPYDDAVINIQTPNPAVISSNLSATPRDILVGVAAGANGRLDHTAGNAATGSVNWMNVGANGGTGVYNLANTAAAGTGYTAYGQGGGSMTVGGRLQIGQGGSNGTVNVNTSGTLTVNASGADAFKIGEGAGGVGQLNFDGGTIAVPNGEFWVGQAAGRGTLQMSAGTLNIGNWVAIGRQANSSGTVNFSGGTINKTGGGHFIVGDNGTGVMTQSGGALNVNNELWVGQGGTSNGKYTLSAGAISVGSWVAVGRDGGTGTFDMTGGTFVKTTANAGSNFIVGASGPGTMNQSAGLVDVQSGLTWVGEGNNTTGTLNLSGTAEFRTGTMELGVNGGTTGNVNLNGGTLRAGQLRGGNGTANAVFNGTEMIATGDQAAFITNLDSASLGAGGLRVNSNGFSLGTAQTLTGAGGLVKSGPGTLALSGGNTYTGATSVTGGTLLINGSQMAATGLVTVSAGGTLGGTGSLGGGLDVQSGGILAPGASAGTLTAGGSAAFAAGSQLSYELLGTDPAVGGGINDLLTGVTNLTLDGTVNIFETTAGSFLAASAGEAWRLISYTGSLTDNGLALGTVPALAPGLSFAVDTSIAGQVNLTVVPEPGPLSGLAVSLAGLGLRRRRRKV